MAKMKKKQQNEKLYCPYCGGLAVLRPAEYVYGCLLYTSDAADE